MVTTEPRSDPTMNSSVPMIDLSSGDDEEVDYAMMRSYLPMPGPSDGEMEVPSLLFGNGNLCRSTLSINQPSMAPSPFSEITVSSQRPLVARSGSNSSEHTALMKEALKKKPVADIAHVSMIFLKLVCPNCCIFTLP